MPLSGETDELAVGVTRELAVGVICTFAVGVTDDPAVASAGVVDEFAMSWLTDGPIAIDVSWGLGTACRRPVSETLDVEQLTP